MAAAQSFLSLVGFENLYKDEKPYYEYWFGEAIQKKMPNSLHGTVQLVLGMVLYQRGWRAASEVKLKLSDLAQPIPDLIADPRPIERPYPTEPFELCVEIVSPDDDVLKLFQKAAHYLDWGIQRVWIIDPQEQNAYSMTIESPVPAAVTITGCLTAGSDKTAISIPLSELFSEVDKMLGA